MVGSEDKVIRFLFRFRDLVAPTVEEHRRTISEHKSCWWGWWKRPSEDNRIDVWQAIKEAVADGNRVPVGLFDSGNDDVYRAWVTEIVLPLEESQSTNATPSVPAGELALVPGYYRESPFSRAWMRLIEIEEPIKFFGEYSFAEAPNLPNYTSETLARLNGKVILSPDELRGMDTTIWKVRPRVEGDLEEKIIFTTPRLPGAISHEVVRCQSDIILHITDPHFSTGGNRAQHVWRLEGEIGQSGTTMAEAITQASSGRKIGLIIVTGDLTFTGEVSEFQEAARSLQRLLGNLDLNTEHLVVVPGNHDIRWTTSAIYRENDEVTAAPAAARANYITFYRQLFRHEPSPHLSMGRRYLLPCGLAVEVCALNSSSLETGKNFLAGMGRIEEASFGDVAVQLGWAKSTMALRILAVHHHLALTENLEPAAGYLRGYGLAVDAVRIQRMAAKHGVQLALHGHKHRAFIWRSSIYELPEFSQPEHRLGPLSIAGGGSAGSKDTTGNCNYFNLLQLRPGALQLEIFRSEHKGMFGLMQTWSAEMAIGPSKTLVLGDWLKVQ